MRRTPAQKPPIPDAAGKLHRGDAPLATHRYDADVSSASAFALFGTPVGDCALAWNAVGLTGVWLPESDCYQLRARVRRRRPLARETVPCGPAAEAVAAMTRLLQGERLDLRELRLDESSLDPFDREVYAAARAIAPGRVVTYAMLAARVGAPATARAVGEALGRNPFPIVVPCHRIVAANGQLGGFSAPGGAATKRLLLTIEDARLDDSADLFDTEVDTAPTATDR
jgi:methylated-DNA-[protein]-cysteine S-methyltransferase